MHVVKKIVVTSLCILLAGSAVLSAQEPEEGDFKIGVSVNQVFLSVTARSLGEGGFFKGLAKEHFQVFEDGVQQQILNFTQEAVPVRVVLLIDASGSTRYSQASIRLAAEKFAESLSPEDRVAIITFNDAPRLILDWSNNLEHVRHALETIYAKGPTVMNDALYVTFDDLLKDVPGKKAVLMLTDGVDTTSQVSMSDAIDVAVRSEALVYVASKLDEYWESAIGQRQQFRAHGRLVPNSLTDTYILDAKKGLQRLANVTGGRVLKAQAFSSLTEVYQAVADELKNQYYLSYEPSNIQQDGRWRRVEIRALQLGVSVTTRQGYFAPGTPPQESLRP